MGKAHVYIYGDIDHYEDEFGAEWGFVNLKQVKAQLDSQKDADEIVVHIHSYGGSVYTGFGIYDLLKAQGKPITTQVEGLCASIASIIFLAGDTRIVGEASEIMIHNPWGGAWGNAEDLEKYASQLRDLEQKLAEIYAKNSNWTVAEALEKMKDETWMTQAQAKESGLANADPEDMSMMAKISFKREEMRAVALFKPNTDMSKTDEGKKTLLELFNSFLKGKKEEVVKALKLTTGDGQELDFYEIESEEDIEVGVKAKADGKNASGDYVMPDGKTFKFESGKLLQIDEADDDEEVKALKAQIKALEETGKAKDVEIAQIKADQAAFEQKVNEFLKNVEGDFVLDDRGTGASASEGGNPGGKKRSLLKD